MTCSKWVSITAFPVSAWHQCWSAGSSLGQCWQRDRGRRIVVVGYLTSQRHTSVSQGRICLDNFTYCHTEIEVADQTFHLTQSQYTDTWLTSPSTDPITPGIWESSHWFVCCWTSQQQASVSQGRICSDNFTCCHTEIEVADPTFYLTQSQYTDTGPTSPSADPITPGAW